MTSALPQTFSGSKVECAMDCADFTNHHMTILIVANHKNQSKMMAAGNWTESIII